MTVIPQGTAEVQRQPQEDGIPAGTGRIERLSEAGGLTLFGAYIQTLDPGARSSDRHWHEVEDEFLHVLEGELTVIENDGAHVLGPGDSCCWPGGVANAHCVENRSAAPVRFLIVGDRPGPDRCHYPDLGRTQIDDADGWRVVDDATGAVLRKGSFR